MSVYQAINAVQKALNKTGITKDRKNTFDGYNFRGIDDVYNALSPLLAENGLCILPRVLSRLCEERVSRKGDPMFYVTVEAEFDFVCSKDGSKHTVKTFGEAMDRSDKATNKAMSAAYKYAALQAFAIPTEADNDADAETHIPAATKPKQIDQTKVIDSADFSEQYHMVIAELAELDSAGAAELGQKVAASKSFTEDELTALRAAFKNHMAKHKVAA